MRTSRTTSASIALVAVLFLVVVSSTVPASALGAPLGRVRSAKSVPNASDSAALSLHELLGLPLAAVAGDNAAADAPGSRLVGPDGSGGLLHAVITLRVANSQALQAELAEIGTSGSGRFHHYLTAAEFDQNFSPSATVTQELTAYLESFGARQITVSADRLTVTFAATVSTIDGIFHTRIGEFQDGASVYEAPAQGLELPSVLADAVLQIDGLSSAPGTQLHSDLASISYQTQPFGAADTGASQQGHPLTSSGYPLPPTLNGTQLEYGPDFQVAYDEPSLFAAASYPTNAVVATILWSGEYTGPATTTPYGTLTTDEPVGSFVPGDVAAFYNETLPAGEPLPHAYGVPVLSAPAPGPLASWDSTGAWVENTLDLEMVGSTAPGASIYNVYGPNATVADADAAFSFILNPNASAVGLRNVSVISNSWGGPDGSDPTWTQDLEEAQARGITVLASSGDSGDSPSSTKNVGGPDLVEFPASDATDTYGVIAVGGATVELGADLHIADDVAWMDHRTNQGGPYGSTGGISIEYPEPTWQASTEANSVIAGAGRGVPDVAAVANDTLITISEQGIRYDATNASTGGAFLYVAGTSIAAPLTAGLVAEIDHVLSVHDLGGLGFLDPEAYSIANQEYSPLENTTRAGYVVSGAYAAALPTLPFLDISRGANAAYSALPGYDLVTGWGSLDAYNFTMYVLSVPSVGVSGRLTGVQATLNLSALSVTTRSSTGMINTAFNASIQQDFFLANSLGAPVFWIQNEIDLASGATGLWNASLTGGASYPFPGLYPTLTVREYNGSQPGLVTGLPTELNITASLIVPAGPTSAELQVSMDNTEATLAVPGAAWILGNASTSYSWQGTNFSNGPWHNRSAPGILAPQFGLLGGPTGGIGDFSGLTSGNVSARIEPAGQSFETATTQEFGLNLSQAAESAANLSWSLAHPDLWTFVNHTGSSDQGILVTEAATAPYSVNFTETGLPTGTSWAIEVMGGETFLSNSADLDFALPNGTYSYDVSTASHAYAASVPSGTIHVQGSGVEVTVDFLPVAANVTFVASGLPSGTEWSVSFGTLSNRSSSSEVGFRAVAGTYSYVVAGVPGFETPVTRGNVTVSGENVAILVPFSTVLYAVSFTATGLPSGDEWSVTLGGVTEVSQGPVITFQEPNGSFDYSVLAPSGYLAHAPSSSLTVSGAAVSISIPIGTSTSPGLAAPFGLSWLEVGLVLLVALALVVGLVIAVARRRRRSPPEGVPSHVQ